MNKCSLLCCNVLHPDCGRDHGISTWSRTQWSELRGWDRMLFFVMLLSSSTFDTSRKTSCSWSQGRPSSLLPDGLVPPSCCFVCVNSSASASFSASSSEAFRVPFMDCEGGVLENFNSGCFLFFSFLDSCSPCHQVVNVNAIAYLFDQFWISMFPPLEMLL